MVPTTNWQGNKIFANHWWVRVWASDFQNRFCAFSGFIGILNLIHCDLLILFWGRNVKWDGQLRYVFVYRLKGRRISDDKISMWNLNSGIDGIVFWISIVQRVLKWLSIKVDLFHVSEFCQSLFHKQFSLFSSLTKYCMIYIALYYHMMPYMWEYSQWKN